MLLQLVTRLGYSKKKFKLVAEIGKGIGWERLWDSVMDLGVKHIKGCRH